ncbi:MAG: methyltransferase domain-containing protein [Pseudomonadales bacterium]
MSNEKAQARFSQYVKQHKQYFGEKLAGPMLEYGCGAGQFLITAHAAGIACHGVEVEQARAAQFRANVAAQGRDHLNDYFKLYDGVILPYSSKYFNVTYSWFVLEHVHDIWTSLREIVRVTKVGGAISLATQDARNCYDGHCDTPWPLLLPAHLVKAYLEEFGHEESYIDYMCKEVFYVTTPLIASTLKALNCEIIYQSADPTPTCLDSINIRTADQAKAYARKVKTLIDHGQWARPMENAIVYARRLS